MANWLSRLNPFAAPVAPVSEGDRLVREHLAALESRLKRLTSESVDIERAPYLTRADYDDGWPGDRAAYARGYPNDRKFGQNYPTLRNENDLRLARITSRLLAETNPLVIGFTGHITNFVVGSGFKWHVGLKGQPGDADNGDPDARAGQQVLDEFRALNGWGDGGEATAGDWTDEDDSPPTDLESEGYESAMEDGEFFLRLFRGDARTNGVPTARKVNPECVYCPPGETQEGPWSFGVLTDAEDRQTRKAYHVADPDAYPTRGEIVPASRMLHFKLNAKTDVKRGIPDFWPLEHEAIHLRKLWRNMAEVSAILSAIAYLRQHAPQVTGDQIRSMVAAGKSGTDGRSAKWGDTFQGADQVRTFTRHEAGTIIDVTNQMVYEPGPINAGAPGFIQGMQATLRIFGLRWGCPEYFSGDASNANFASTLVAGGPFERATTRRQTTYKRFQERLAIRVLQLACEAGRLTRAQVARLSVSVTPPGVAIANKAEDTQRRSTLFDKAGLSAKTWLTEEGYDAEQEQANKQAEQPPPQPGMGGPGAPVPGQTPAGPDQGGGSLADLLGESRLTEDRIRRLHEINPPDGFLPDGTAFYLEDRAGLVKKVITNKHGHKQTVYVRQGADVAPAADASVQGRADSRTAVATAVGQLDRLTMSQMHRLADHIGSLTRDEIRGHLKALGEKIGGAKVELATRLLAKVKAAHATTEPFVQLRPEVGATTNAMNTIPLALPDAPGPDGDPAVASAQSAMAAVNRDSDFRQVAAQWQKMVGEMTPDQQKRLADKLGVDPKKHIVAGVGRLKPDDFHRGLIAEMEARLKPAVQREAMAKVVADPKKYGFSKRDVAKLDGLIFHPKKLNSRDGRTPDEVYAAGDTVVVDYVPHVVVAAAKATFTRGYRDSGEQVGPNQHRQNLLIRPMTDAEKLDDKIKKLEKEHGTYSRSFDGNIDHSAELERLRAERDAVAAKGKK